MSAKFPKGGANPFSAIRLVIGLIKWFKPKGLKVCSYVESVLNSKIKLLKNRLVHKNAMCNGIPPEYAISQNSA